MRIFEKRKQWCIQDKGRLYKFSTKAEAESFAGLVEPVEETLDAEEENEAEDSEEEAGSDE